MTVSQLLRKLDNVRREVALVEFHLRSDLAGDYVSARRRLGELEVEEARLSADIVEAVG